MINLETSHEAIYDDVMADTITRLVAIYNDMPTLLQPACPYGTTSQVEEAARAVCLALLILDDCCTRGWATRRIATGGRASAHGIGSAKTSLVGKEVESRTTRFAGSPGVIIGSR